MNEHRAGDAVSMFGQLVVRPRPDLALGPDGCIRALTRLITEGILQGPWTLYIAGALDPELVERPVGLIEADRDAVRSGDEAAELLPLLQYLPWDDKNVWVRFNGLNEDNAEVDNDFDRFDFANGDVVFLSLLDPCEMEVGWILEDHDPILDDPDQDPRGPFGATEMLAVKDALVMIGEDIPTYDTIAPAAWDGNTPRFIRALTDVFGGFVTGNAIC